jgi:hypothetical protein
MPTSTTLPTNMLEIAVESADEFLAQARAAHSSEERFELLRRRFEDNHLLLAIWRTQDEFRYLPVKGAELLSDPEHLIMLEGIRFAGVPCVDEDNARALIYIGYELTN